MSRKFLSRKLVVVIAVVTLAALFGRIAMSDPPRDQDPPAKVKLESATFGSGCFWCTEAVFQELEGVYGVQSGYSGGKTVDPTYEQICEGDTGHAEVVQVSFDPQVVAYADLLEVFWKTHDPTTLNRQGPDVGSQYRSAIFFHTHEQEAAARASIERLSSEGRWPRPIVTQVERAGDFYRAEDYHQQYVARRGGSSCHF